MFKGKRICGNSGVVQNFMVVITQHSEFLNNKVAYQTQCTVVPTVTQPGSQVGVVVVVVVQCDCESR